MPHSFPPLLSATPMSEGFSCYYIKLMLRFIHAAVAAFLKKNIWNFFSIKENLTNSEKQKEEKITHYFTTTVHVLVYLSPRFLFFT